MEQNTSISSIKEDYLFFVRAITDKSYEDDPEIAEKLSKLMIW